MDEKKTKGLGLFALIGLVVSSCIGSGIFALTGQLAEAASPGGALLGWLVAGIGFLTLALSLVNLSKKKPELTGIFQYATEGFGPLAGFVSGWGYWLSDWVGSVAFATMMCRRWDTSSPRSSRVIIFPALLCLPLLCGLLPSWLSAA